MAEERRTSSGFRKKLRDELAEWQAQGLVSPEQARDISARYSLDALSRESAGLLLAAMYVIGSVLLAAGIVSFVAAHWEAIPTAAKVALIVGAMLAAHAAGAYLWQVRGTRPWLGHALVILGTLLFGANIGLMAQIFHIHSDFYNGFGAWAIGALAVAYALGSLPTAFIAVVTSFLWFCGWIGHHEHEFSWYPFVMAALLAPLVLRKRSAVIALTGLLAVGLAVLIHAASEGDDFWPFALSTAAVGSLYGSLGFLAKRREKFARLGAVAVILGVAAAGTVAYLLSFRGISEEMFGHTDLEILLTATFWWAVPAGAALAGSIPLWLVLASKRRRGRPVAPLAVGLFASAALSLGAIGAAAWPATREIVPAVLGNLAALALAAGLIAGGVAAVDRLAFWLGILVVVAVILGRFFEYETGLILKAVAFLACGAGVILAGLWFETFLRRRRAAP